MIVYINFLLSRNTKTFSTNTTQSKKEECYEQFQENNKSINAIG